MKIEKNDIVIRGLGLSIRGMGNGSYVPRMWICDDAVDVQRDSALTNSILCYLTYCNLFAKTRDARFNKHLKLKFVWNLRKS